MSHSLALRSVTYRLYWQRRINAFLNHFLVIGTEPLDRHMASLNLNFSSRMMPSIIQLGCIKV